MLLSEIIIQVNIILCHNLQCRSSIHEQPSQLFEDNCQYINTIGFSSDWISGLMGKLGFKIIANLLKRIIVYD